MAGQNESPIGVTWDDAAFIRNLKRDIQKMQDTTEADVKAAGIKWVNRAKSYAPVRTGFMKNNIVMEESRDAKGYFVAIYCRASYWKFVEFGTRFVTAQPFMRPAFAEALSFLKSRIQARRR